jgi:hypothetical protein
MKYKSFITSIQLNDLEFQSGKVFYLTEFVHTQADGKLIINQSLKDYKTIDEKKFFLREILK